MNKYYAMLDELEKISAAKWVKALRSGAVSAGDMAKKMNPGRADLPGMLSQAARRGPRAQAGAGARQMVRKNVLQTPGVAVADPLKRKAQLMKQHNLPGASIPQF